MLFTFCGPQTVPRSGEETACLSVGQFPRCVYSLKRACNSLFRARPSRRLLCLKGLRGTAIFDTNIVSQTGVRETSIFFSHQVLLGLTLYSFDRRLHYPIVSETPHGRFKALPLRPVAFPPPKFFPLVSMCEKWPLPPEGLMLFFPHPKRRFAKAPPGISAMEMIRRPRSKRFGFSSLSSFSFLAPSPFF